MKKEETEGEWDLKKIAITIFFVIVGFLVLIELKKTLLPNLKLPGSTGARQVVVQKPNVKAPVNVQSVVGSKIEEIKNSVSNIDPSEIASSSPQIQKVLHDIEGIKDLPADQAKQACLKICSGL